MLLVVAAALLAGCTGSFCAAQVPGNLLQGDGGNGWASDADHSDASPRSESAGLVVRQTRAYADDGKGGNAGYPASLVLTTLRLFPTPSEDKLRDILRQQVQERAASQGIKVDQQSTGGARTLADGHRSLFFVFTGTVNSTGPLFTTRDATAKIVGEVWNCPESGTSAVAVGFAQVTNTVRGPGGVPIQTNENTQNWRELVGDPSGSVEGQRASDGLLYNVTCKC